MNKKHFFLCTLFIPLLLLTACVFFPGGYRNDMSSAVVSIEINGEIYSHGTSSPIQLITDEIFKFKVVLQNNGTSIWGNAASGQHGASLLSRGDPSHDENDYNETFGVFFVLYPWQNRLVVEPGEQMTYDTIFRAPSEPGTYTMRWQTAEWPVGMNQGSHISETDQTQRDRPINYFNSAFFGTEIVVEIIVTERLEQSPYVSKPGVLEASDFEYVGSFALPQVWTGLGDVGFTDTKTFRDSGITLRKVGDELRMLLVTGTYNSNLYEVAVPALGDLGIITGTDVSSVPIAELTTNFSGQSILDINNSNESYWDVGSMWYDQETEWLYWTNNTTYPAGGYPAGLPILFYARLEGDQVVNRQSWEDPLRNDASVPLCTFMGGVTTIPENIANQYFGGRRLALGFGGAGSIITHRSVGPTLGAVSVNNQGIVQDDLLPIMYYPYTGAAGIDAAPRDGNYLHLGTSNIPPSPWEGRWTSGDYIRSGVFIDYNGKQGYMTFAHQVIGRRSYDYGGANFWSRHQNAWYFYDLETLAGGANGIRTGLLPSSFNVVEYPSGNAVLHTDSRVSGSCFDQETGLLYLYVKRANGSQPLVHVYQVN